MRRSGRPIALVFVLLAALPASALAKHHHHPKPPPAVQRVLEDCSNHNYLHGHYSISVLTQALRDMPTDDREYSICASEIENAIHQELTPSRPAPKASAAAKEKIAQNSGSELKQAQSAGHQPVSLGPGAKIAAGAVQVNGGSLLGGLPTPILVLLIALVVGGGIPLGIRLRNIARARNAR